jgi:uncharacterized protein (TIGR03382 family)
MAALAHCSQWLVFMNIHDSLWPRLASGALSALIAIPASLGSAQDGATPLCSDGNVNPYAAVLPANVPSFLVYASGSSLRDGSSVHLFRVSEGVEIEVPTTVTVTAGLDGLTDYVVQPSAELTIEDHVLRYDPCPADGPIGVDAGPGGATGVASERRYSVVPAVPLPDGPGELAVRLIAWVADGRIVDEDVELAVSSASASLEPWADVLAMQVSIGEHQHRAPSRIAGRTATFSLGADCVGGGAGRVPPGEHEATGTIGGFGATPLLDVHSTVTIDCAHPTYVWTSSREPLTEEEIAELDLTPRTPTDAGIGWADGAIPVADAAVATRDAGAREDAARPPFDGVIDDEAPARASSCSASGGGGGSATWLALVALGAMLARRRRAAAAAARS